MLYQAIKLLYPGITDDQFQLQDNCDMAGPFIARWDRPEPMPTQEQIDAVMPQVQGQILSVIVQQAVQQRLDDFARTRGYDDIKSAVGYVGDEDPAFDAEGTYARHIRSRCWRACYNIMGAVQAGLRPLPTLEEVMDEVPTPAWPA